MKEGGGSLSSNTSFLSGCAEKVKLLVKWYVGACIFLMHDGILGVDGEEGLSLVFRWYDEEDVDDHEVSDDESDGGTVGVARGVEGG